MNDKKICHKKMRLIIINSQKIKRKLISYNFKKKKKKNTK